MRRRATPILRNVPPVKLYLDDIERIVAILFERTRSEIQIAVEDYELDAVGELGNLGRERIDLLQIQPINKAIRLDLGPESASISATAPTAENRGIIAEVEDVLRKCTRGKFWRFWHYDQQRRAYKPPYSTVILKERSEDVSFLSRKQDDILLLVIGAFLGSGATIAVDLMVRALT